MFRVSYATCATACCLLFLTVSVRAQSTPPLATTEKANPLTATPTPDTTPGENKFKFSRWIEIQAASLGTLYVYGDTPTGTVLTKQIQPQVALKGKFKFDAQGKFSISAGLISNNNFMGDEDGLSARQTIGSARLHLRHLYFAARPIKGIEVQFGGLDVMGGVGTEITGFADESYLMGERLLIERPKQFFFDQVALTYGYVEGFTTPSVTKRWNQLKKSNYHQFLVAKNIGTRATFSAHYTFLNGVESLAEAIIVDIPESRVLDRFRFENYQRLDVNPAFGFAIQGEKALTKRFSLGGGFAQIDPNAGDLNSDAFFSGRRVFVSAKFSLTPAFSVATLFNHAVGNNFTVPKRNHFHLVFTYDLLKRFGKS